MSNRTIDVFEGWHKYPHNLLFSLIEVDPLRCNDRLARDAERLFVPEEDSRLGMLEFGPVGQDGTREVEHTVLESSEQLSACFKRSYSSWIFFIRQSYTWSRLLISEEIFRRLFTRLKVHPDFLDVVHIFGEKVGPVEESFSAFFAQLSPQPSITTAIGENVHSCSYEIGFNIKYVAEHGRSYPNDPYSIRETGVYQKYCSDTQTCNWIFIQPSDEFRDRLERALVSANDAAPMNQFQIHVLVLLSVSENWRDYINYLEGTFSKLVDRGFFTNIKGPAMEGDIEADFSDIRRLQILTDKLRRLVHILQLNTNLGVQLKSSMQRVKTASPVTLAAAFEDFDLKIDLYLFQHQTHSARLQSLIARGQGISSLIQNILDIRTVESNKKINAAMRDVARQGIQENQLIKKLTYQMTQDTSSMRIIALISAIFLPATFLATLFGSNFFAFRPGGHDNTLVVASNVWIYVVTALMLSGITVLLWLWWWSRTRAKSRRHDREEGEADLEKDPDVV